MSEFAVTLETIKSVEKHSNADALDIVYLEGINYQFVTLLGMYKAGDEVVYFPVDSLLPDPIMELMGLTQLAHGDIPEDEGVERKRNRVKTVKLRGAISQGVVCTLMALDEFNPKLELSLRLIESGDDIAKLLGVTKYEPPVVSQKGGDLVQMPDLVSVYDIEGAQRYPEIVAQLMGVSVVITEKVEGSNWWASLTDEGEFVVGQRNYAIRPNEEGVHDWWKVAEALNIKSVLEKIMAELEETYSEHVDGFYPTEDQINIQRVTLRGEIVGPGIQANYYKLKDHKVFMFEVEVNGNPVDAEIFVSLMAKYNLETAPVLAINQTLHEWLDGKTVQDASDGMSLITKRKREGIVIKPESEMETEGFGRVFIKQRSPAYLAKTDN